jgi:hypothetical protein
MKDNNIQVHTRKALCGRPCTSPLPESSPFCTQFVAEEFNAGESKLFTTKGHIGYCGLIPGQQVSK